MCSLGTVVWTVVVGIVEINVIVMRKINFCGSGQVQVSACNFSFVCMGTVVEGRWTFCINVHYLFW